MRVTRLNWMCWHRRQSVCCLPFITSVSQAYHLIRPMICYQSREPPIIQLGACLPNSCSAAMPRNAFAELGFASRPHKAAARQCGAAQCRFVGIHLQFLSQIIFSGFMQIVASCTPPCSASRPVDCSEGCFRQERTTMFD